MQPTTFAENLASEAAKGTKTVVTYFFLTYYHPTTILLLLIFS